MECPYCKEQIADNSTQCPLCNSSFQTLTAAAEPELPPFGYFIKCVKEKYIGFEGRARRKEYWFFVLFSTLISIGFSILQGIGGAMNSGALVGLFSLLSIVYSLGVLLPSIAVGVRRLHDTGKSGWFMFLMLIPLVGAIILLVFFVQPSQPGTNEYGDNPLGE